MTVGILGAGQLARMMAEAAQNLGIDVIVYDPKESPSASFVCEHIKADYSDERALNDFAGRVDVFTYEFENIPIQTLEFLSKLKPVYPTIEALRITQDRLDEKICLNRLGIPTPQFLKIDSEADIKKAATTLGYPFVIKTRQMGYDGKGQAILKSDADIEKAWAMLGRRALIAEAFIHYDREVSIIGVRSQNGDIRTYDVVENTHHNGILYESLNRPNDTIAPVLKSHLETLMTHFDYVGVLTIEFFVIGDTVFANEYAPRVHNSGHWTIEGAKTSQFDNHIRAITGRALGGTGSTGYAQMLNVIGQMPNASDLDEKGFVRHDYQKIAKPGRKVGHFTRVSNNILKQDKHL